MAPFQVAAALNRRPCREDPPLALCAGHRSPVDEHVRDHSTAEANLIVMSDARGRSGRKEETAMNAMVAIAAIAAERGLSDRRVGDLDEAGQETRFWSSFR